MCIKTIDKTIYNFELRVRNTLLSSPYKQITMSYLLEILFNLSENLNKKATTWRMDDGIWICINGNGYGKIRNKRILLTLFLSVTSLRNGFGWFFKNYIFIVYSY